MTAQKRIFAAVLLTSFIGPFLGSCINIAIPTIAVEFSCPATDLSWLATAFLLGAVALLLPFGRMADILGRCRIYAIGTAAMAARASSSSASRTGASSSRSGAGPSSSMRSSSRKEEYR